ncbi:MAG: toll/interleukin-1 receptor domain-containing protein [Acidimicrobiia bacterium]
MNHGDPYFFVSYSRTDQACVDRLVADLARRGVQTWIDRHTDYGQRWPTVIRDRVDGCVGLLVVMTPAAEASVWVERELHRAEAKRKPVVPLLLEGDPFFVLGATQYEPLGRDGRVSERFVSHLHKLVTQWAPSAAPPVAEATSEAEAGQPPQRPSNDYESLLAAADPSTRRAVELLDQLARSEGWPSRRNTRQACTWIARPQGPMVIEHYLDKPGYSAIGFNLSALRRQGRSREADDLQARLQDLSPHKRLTAKMPAVPVGDVVQRWPQVVDIVRDLARALSADEATLGRPDSPKETSPPAAPTTRVPPRGSRPWVVAFTTAPPSSSRSFRFASEQSAKEWIDRCWREGRIVDAPRSTPSVHEIVEISRPAYQPAR